ncbi:MAG: hypothetical protein ACK6DK_06830, partial [Gemmatimonadota bacterium]
MIVDRHVDELPADAAGARTAVAVDAVPHAADLPELLDVEVDELAGLGSRVASHGRRGRQGGQAGEADAPRVRDDGRQRQLEVLRNAGAAPASAAGLLNLAAAMPGQQ